MPAQKRSDEMTPPRSEDENTSVQQKENVEEQAEEEASDGSSVGDEEEFLTVKLADVRKEVQCPICLGIIRKTRTVMECLHRFCRECIDKSMRLGNNECPACRTHCASRRSLRDDPNYDALIAALYPDIDKYEEEELAFHEDEKARNKQIQDSIAEIMRRQTEALGRKRNNPKATNGSNSKKSQGSYRSLRGRRNQRAAEVEVSDDEEDANGLDEGKDSFSSDENMPEVKPKRYKRWGRARCSQTSIAAGGADGAGDENNSDAYRDAVGAAAALVGSAEMLAWGGAAARSNTRHGNLGGGNGKIGRAVRGSKLRMGFRNVEKKDDEFDISVKLVPLNKEKIPSLQSPTISCRPTVAIQDICKHVAQSTDVRVDDVEILLVKGIHSKPDPIASPGVEVSACGTIDPCKDELHILEEHETIAELLAMFSYNQANLILAYRQKLPGLVDY